ncbi:MAG: hypothetical protein ACREBN_12725 [Burkholderiaceae bacterium]
MARSPALFAVLVGGFVAGALDIIYAIVFYGLRGVPADRILQSIASGLLGSEAYRGGWATAAFGLFLHFVIAFAAAAIFFAASRRLPFINRRVVVSGMLFGVAVYGVMNLIVLPLSAYPHKISFPPLILITGLLAHMFLFGLPIALATRQASKRDLRQQR